MSRLFDALQNAGHDITGKYGSPADPRVVELVTGRPRISTKKGDSRYFGLLNSLKSLETHRGGFVIALMGPHGGEGTSTVTRELADFISRQTDDRSLVLDCRPKRVAPATDIQRLAHDQNQATLPIAADPSAQTSGQHLSYAEATMLADSSGRTESSTSGDLAPFFDLVAADYDWVIMDCAPALRHDYDNRFARLADAVILVVESERSEVSDVIHASNKLKLADANVLGVILNKRPDYVPSFLRRLLDRLRFD